MVIEIPLTRGYVALIDEEDFELVSRYKWSASAFPKANSIYAMTNSKTVNGKRHTILLHRFIMRASSGELVDHIDGNGLDNQRDNLRKCSRSENGKNRVCVAKHNTSGTTGVHYHIRKKKWQASIAIDGKNKCLGSFLNKVDAVEARKLAEEHHYKEFSPKRSQPDGGNQCKQTYPNLDSMMAQTG